MPSRPGYDPIFAAAAVEYFVGLPRRRQRRLLMRVRELANDPFVIPDFASSDAAGRTISHLVVDELIFDYWVDHAVRQIVILAIEPVG